MKLTVSIEDGKITFGYSTKDSPKIRHKGKSLLELPDSYVVLDLETTGYSPEYDEIIEIGVLKIRENVVVDVYSSLVYNDFVDEYISNLTGITTEMTLQAPKIDIVLNELLGFIQDDIIIAHNANFDVNFLYDALELNLNKIFHNDFIDTLRLARRAYPEFKSHRLKYLTENIPLKNIPTHRSLSDCYATLELFEKCKNKIIVENIELKTRSSSRASRFKASDIAVCDNSIFDEENPLFNKMCVFTGTLEKMVRKEAMQAVVNIGGLVGDGITSKTDYLIVGIQDYRRFVDGKESSKMKKAKSLIENGKDLRIISENEFYEMIFGITVDGD